MSYYDLYSNDYLKRNGRVFGNESTYLELPETARRILAETDPCTIYELEDSDHEGCVYALWYSIRGVIDADDLTAQDVIDIINGWAE